MSLLLIIIEKSKTLYNNHKESSLIGDNNHDTIGMIAIELNGNIAAGTSTNGLNHKIHGRVGDSPIIGSGGYVEHGIGAAVGTGNGDIMMRFAPTSAVIHYLEMGIDLQIACQLPIIKMAKLYPNSQAALLCVDAKGNHAGACYGWTFSYNYRDASMSSPKTVTVPPIQLDKINLNDYNMSNILKNVFDSFR